MPYNLRSRKIKNLDVPDATVSDEQTAESSDDTSSDTAEVTVSNTLDSEDDEMSSDDESYHEGDDMDEFVKRWMEKLLKNKDDDFLSTDYLKEEWKKELKTKGVSDAKIKELEKTLNTLIEEINVEMPNIQTILDGNLSKEQKKEAIVLLNTLKNFELDDMEYHTIQKQLMNMINKSKPKFGINPSVDDIETRINNLVASPKIKADIYHFYSTINQHDHQDPNKLERFLKLPYDKIIEPTYTKQNFSQFLQECSERLDRELYGMDVVKQKFLSILSNRMINGTNSKGCAIALKGPPGVGKTHISRVFAECLGLPMFQITLGGARDSCVLVGSDNHWSGSSPGQIADGLMKMGCSNGIIFIDEVDKAANMEIMNSINHVIDFTSNSEFEDKNLREIKIDLSRIWFVLSMNDVHLLPKYVSDRMDIIEVPAYQPDEKREICERFIIPRICKNKDVTFTKDAIKAIVLMSNEKGLREITHIIQHICSKINLTIAMNNNNHKYIELKDFKLPFEVNSKIVQLLAKDLRKKENLVYFT